MRRRSPLGDLCEHRRCLPGVRRCSAPSGSGLPKLARAQATPRPADNRGCLRSSPSRRQVRGRDLRRTDARRPSHRAAGRDAAPARRRAGQAVNILEGLQQRRAQLELAQQVGAHKTPRCRSEMKGAHSGGPARGRGLTAPRTCLGSMKRTSSRTASTSEMSSTPRSRKRATSWTSRFSGALAPEEMPTTHADLRATPRAPRSRCRSGERRCRSRARPRPAAPSSRSCASRSRASDRSCRRAA